MRHLPAIECGPGRWVLPMADRSAALLTELLLAGDRIALSRTLAKALASDPPMAIWTAVNAARSGWRFSSVSDLAQWLARSVLAALQWPTGWRELLRLAEYDSRRFAGLLRESLSLGWLAEELASAGSPVQSEAAALAGLLHNAPRWLAQSDASRAGVAPSQLSEWLSGLSTEALGAAAQAKAILEGERAAPDIDVAAIRGRAEQAARAWAEPMPGAGDWLPALASRLARLEQLEHRFDQSLESEKLEAMAELAAGAGHEINNPLAIIAGRAQLFLQDETDPERRREAAIIVAQVKRAHEMIADLRLFARPPLPEPRDFDLTAVIDALFVNFAPTAAERSVELARTGHSEPLIVTLDPAQITVAVQALVRNALEAIGREGRIEVGLDGDERWVIIRVADNGPGIAAEHRRHIFEPFFSARQAGRGLGMGLSKCWRIVANHGGQIEVESQPGQGAVFTVRLPRRHGPSPK